MDDEKCCNGKKEKKRVSKSGIAWLAVSGWAVKLKSFGGIRERDVERACEGVGNVVG